MPERKPTEKQSIGTISISKSSFLNLRSSDILDIFGYMGFSSGMRISVQINTSHSAPSPRLDSNMINDHREGGFSNRKMFNPIDKHGPHRRFILSYPDSDDRQRNDADNSGKSEISEIYGGSPNRYANLSPSLIESDR